ncbi:pentatricopeptide repeat-containing protein At3g09040, mitochondrial [Aristolochia californica]|uniref:pentatricopeptide repeat-containing protein At3g09040, mitochondrial n=1 Tax=Aristolochia californica TaxID=171875 RepID=UPI0035E12C02
MDFAPDLHFLHKLSNLYALQNKSPGAYQLFVKMPTRETPRVPTASRKDIVLNTESGVITDPGFYAYLLQYLLREGNLTQSDRSFERNSQRLRETKCIHAQVVRAGFPLTGNLGNYLLDLYAKYGKLDLALNAFMNLEEHGRAAWNSILSAYSRHGMPEEVIQVFGSMWSSISQPNQCTFAIALSACAKLLDLNSGKLLHCNIIKMGLEFNSFCEGSLIDMYAKCSSLVEARKVFDRVKDPDVIAWTVIITGYVRVGLSDEALGLFLRMKKNGMKPDQVMFVTALTACVHLGRLKEARDLFTQMQNPSVVAWNALISGHAQNGCELESLGFFKEMQGKGIKPTRSTLGSVLSAIANLTALDQGRQVHSEAIKLGLDSNVFVGSSLINMYSKCGILHDARKIFYTLEEKNIVLWNSMLGGFSQHGFSDEAMDLFLEMKHLGVLLDEFTYVTVFNVCAFSGQLEMGLQLHSLIIKSNMESSLYVSNALVDMYGKSGNVKDARRQFEQMLDQDLISWNAMIVGYVHNKEEEEAVIMFQRMRMEEIAPDEVSFASIVSACANILAIALGKQAHSLSIKSGFESNLYVGSALVDMYAKCGVMAHATKAFEQTCEKSVVSRNALISGFVQNKHREEALGVFRQIQAEGLKPSEFTFASILPMFIGPSGLGMGRQVHGYTLKCGLLCDDMHLGVSLIGAYLKSLNKDDAKKLFWELGYGNSTVSWTVLISGHAQNNCGEEAISLFWDMYSYGAWPDQATFASVLSACSSLARLRNGKEVHSIIIKTGFYSDEYTGSALVDMYSKCGEMRDSLQVFSKLGKREDNISWNSMIVGFAKNGFAEDALEIFLEMQKQKVKPDEITFIGVLTACSHAGLVSEGRGFFESMKRKYKIQPRVDHCACIVDLLGRGGLLKEAEEFVYNLPFQSDPVIWAGLLSACRIHGDSKRGKRVAEKLIELEPQNSSPYVLLSNIYAASRNWEGVNKVRKTMQERGVRKLPGCSWIVVANKTNLFVAGDKFHPKGKDIYEVLKELTEVIKENGYVARVDLLLDDED